MYNIILADPPWRYNARNNHSTRFGGGVHAHYPVMTVGDICALDIPSIAAENCALFLWATFPKIQLAFKVIKAWDFTYRTIGFLWVKLNKNRVNCLDGEDHRILHGCGTLGYLDWVSFFGVGYYSKSNPEPCLLAVRGKMRPISNSVSNLVYGIRTTHSSKPLEVRTRIVELFGDLPRIELFARDAPHGWDVWGDEVSSDIEIGEVHDATEETEN